MSRKSSRLGIGSNSSQPKAKQIEIQSVNDEKTRAERHLSRRAFLVLGLMILTVSGFGAVASWRTLATTTASTNSAAIPPLVTGTPPAMPAGAPGKEFIYAGSALLATSESFRAPADDIAVWRPSSGGSTWYILNAQQQINSFQFGSQDDTPLTRDFDGDGKTDFCIYRQSAGQWHIIRSSDSTYYVVNFGTINTDVLAPADYDGDGKADIGVFRPSNNFWYILQSSNNNAQISVSFGAAGDKPESADFDGDGKSDLAVWRDSAASFFVKKSTDGLITGYSIGQNGDQPVVGDYDGDGRADYAVRRLSDGLWQIRRSSDASLFSEYWGLSSDVAVQGNYSDGDAKTDIAVWRPSNGVWYILKSTGGTRTVQFGQAGDIPVPAPYRR